VLRKIFGPICVAGYRRSRTNEEVRQLYGELDILTGILRWLGHVERMSEERVVKRSYQNTPEGRPEDRCHKLEDMCTQNRRLEDGREGGRGPTRTVEPWSSSKTLGISKH